MIPMVTLEMGSGYRRAVAELGSMGIALIEAVNSGLEKGVKLAASNVVENYLTGQALKRRSGALARAVDGWLASPGDGVVGVRPGSAVDDYAWLLTDEQKTITPKKGRYLTIPIGENLTGSGVARFSSPRQVPDGFFIKSKRGQLLFGYRKGKTSRAKFRPLFVLVKSVFIQGSGALYDGVTESLDDISREIETEIDRRPELN